MYKFNVATNEQDDSIPIARGGVSRPFPYRLYDMLEFAEIEGFSQIVSWAPHGKAFKVHKQDAFVAFILPRFFEQSKYPSFQRQLNLYNFSRVTQGPEKGSYFHECFRKDERKLLRSIDRHKLKKGKSSKSLLQVTPEPSMQSKAESAAFTWPKLNMKQSKPNQSDSLYTLMHPYANGGGRTLSQLQNSMPFNNFSADMFEPLQLEEWNEPTRLPLMQEASQRRIIDQPQCFLEDFPVTSNDLNLLDRASDFNWDDIFQR